MKVALLPAITQEEREAAKKADELNRLVWITCRVCDMKSKVPLDNPALLCNPCRVDPIQTRAHVLHLRDTFRERLWRVGERWDAALEKAGPAAYARWGDVEAARVRVSAGEISEEAFTATWRRARAAGGEFAALLLAREACEEEAEACNEALGKLESALEEILTYERHAGAGDGPEAHGGL